jgi:hypothetical protein
VEKQPVAVEVKLQRTGSVTGRVLGEDQQPLPKAFVQLLQHVPDAETKIVFYSSGSSVPVPVEADGSFTIADVVPSLAYNVNVTAPGFASAFGMPFVGEPDATHRMPDIVLPRADQTILGTVVDATGKSLAGVQVYGTPVRAGGIERSVRIAGGQVYSDETGRFRLTGIPRGLVRISAYITPDAVEGERLVRTHGSLMVEAGQQDVELVLAGPDLAAPVKAAVGQPLIEFPVERWVNAHRGDDVRSFRGDDYRNHALLLAFVDGARPSTLFVNRLDDWQRKWSERGLKIVRVYEAPIAAEEIAKASATAAAVVPAGLVAGGYSDAFHKYGVRATPTVFLFDRNGILLSRDPDLDSVDSRLNELLKP